MVNNRLVILASLAFVTSSPVSADGLHSSLSFPQCTDVELSSNFTQLDEMRYDVLRKGKKLARTSSSSTALIKASKFGLIPK